MGERLEGFLRENQLPRVCQDSKRLKRTRDQSPAPETDRERESDAQATTLEAPAPMEQEIPRREGGHNAVRQNAVPPGTVLRNGSLATTIMGPNGTPILRMPGPKPPGPRAATKNRTP